MATRKCPNIYFPKYFMAVRKFTNISISKYFCNSVNINDRFTYLVVYIIPCLLHIKKATDRPTVA